MLYLVQKKCKAVCQLSASVLRVGLTVAVTLSAYYSDAEAWAKNAEELVQAAKAAEDPGLAIEYLIKAREILDPSAPNYRSNLAYLYNEISVLERQRGQPKQALEAAQQAVELVADIPASPLGAIYALNLGLAAFDVFAFDRARDALTEAAELAAAAGADVIRAQSLRNLGAVDLAEGDYGAAEASLDGALALLGPNSDPETEVAILQSLARAHLMQRKAADARKNIDRALSISSKLTDPVVRLDSQILSGRVALQEARFEEASRILEDAVEDAAALGSRADVARGSALYNLAEIDFMRGRFSEADALNQEAERLFSRALNRNHYLIAQTIHRRAVIYQEVGDLETAVDLYAAASERLLRLFGPDHPLVLSTAVERSRALARLGRHEEAVALARDVVSRLDPARDDLLYDRSLATAALGLALHDAHRDDEAREALEAAMALRFGHDMPIIDEPPGWNALAEIYLAQGDTAAARQAILRAVDILEKTTGLTIDRLGESRRILADIERVDGNRAAALSLARQNLDAAKDRLHELSLQASYTSEFTPAALRSQVGQALELIWDKGAATDEDRAEMFLAAQLLHLNETTRATNGIVGRSEDDQGPGADLLRERRQLTEDIRALASIIAAQSQDLNAEDATASLDRIADLRARKFEVDVALARAAPEVLSDLSPEPVNVEAVRAALAPDEALWMQILLEHSSFLFLVTSDGLTVVRSDYNAVEAETDVTLLRASVDVANFPNLPPFAFDAAARLFDALFAHFSGDLSRISTFILIPDLAAQQIPLGTLVRADPDYGPEFGGGHPRWRFLGLTHGIAVIPSPTSWLRLRKSVSLDEGNSGFVGFGNPVLRGDSQFDARSMSRAIDRTTGLADPEIIAAIFEPLPETEEELRYIASRHAPENQRLFLQGEATESIARAVDYTGASVVAFATHAIVSGDFDHLSEPALIMTPPVLPGPGDDGLLTTSEIARLTINADIVVLSACNTGSTSGRPGASGLSGLASGFFKAGARSLVVSHWTILSASSLVIMPRVFDYHTAGLPTSEALRRSMHDVANNPARDYFAHPAVWAPFSVIGDQ